MTNKEIARLLKLTTSLLELHEENPFKIRTYTNAVFNIEKQEDPLFEKNREELEELDGIGKGLAQAIIEIQDRGSFQLLDELMANTPEGILEMINLKGLGPKKIKVLWKELNIENVDQLYDACKKGQIEKLKGFGVRTQESILQHLDYLISQRGKVLFADAELAAEKLISWLRDAFPSHKIELTGDVRRKLEVIDKIEILIDCNDCSPITKLLQDNTAVQIDEKKSGPFSLRGTFADKNILYHIRCTEPSKFYTKMMLFTGSGSHLSNIIKDNISLQEYLINHEIEREEAAYLEFNMPYIIPEMREGTFEIAFSNDNSTPELLTLDDIRGPFHNHSNYSDGTNTIRQLAAYCMEQGYEYLGLSDHSKSAFYANGLQEFQIKKQHGEIDQLNEEMAPFRIFKGIESDILNDGSLDYEPNILSSFDFIVASVHSNLNMDRNKATERLLKAIKNPYTTMLGHPTGRLLLQRQGYPIDHKMIIDTCAKHEVIIEINANPWRLDLDWRWVNYAIEKGVILSINPDAHEIEGFKDMKYGVYVGRKGGLTKEMTFNAWDLNKVENYLTARKAKI